LKCLSWFFKLKKKVVLMTFFQLALPHRYFFATLAFLEDKMRGKTKKATKMIIEGQFCSVLKGQDHFRE